MTSKERKKAKQMPVPKAGTCALLGIEGAFAKAHLIPKALTSPSVPGERFIEAGRGNRPIRRFTSWYDHQLVTRDGEKILSEIDTAGIAELRKHKLVWSGWGNKNKLRTSDFAVDPDPGSGLGVRLIEGVDVGSIRLFFLSLLWRSLKTKIKEFSYLPNVAMDLDKIGEMLKNRDSGDPHFHPIALDQISTLGFAHNHSPTLQEIEFPFDEGPMRIPFYRFYMQGLVAHVYPADSLEIFKRMSAVFVGGHEKLWVYTRRFDSTRQFAEAKEAIQDTSRMWPGVF